MEGGLLASVGLTLLLVFVAVVFFKNKYAKSSPPIKRGWIPWVGVAIEFGREPLFFIEKTRKELGDIFTILAVGKKMTFICDHEDHQIFFTSRHASFGAAVQPFTQAAANVSKASFLMHHTKLHDTVKGKLTASYSDALCAKLSKAFHDSIMQTLSNEEKTMDLMTFVRRSMFPAVVGELFGHESFSMTRKEMLEMLDAFEFYDREFEYGVELPSIFVREWTKSKVKLLKIFRNVVQRIKEKNNPPKLLVEHLIQSVDNENAPGFSLLLLWASQANAIPTCFWTLSFILSNSAVLSSIQNELRQLTINGDNITEDVLKSISSVKRATMESLRLRSPGMITRKLTNSIIVKDYTIPAGSLVMLSPYWTHRNPTYFPEPEKFNPDRWLDCDIDKGQFPPGFIAFGGGRYQCPGRWFALMEIQLYISVVLNTLDITLMDPVPSPSPLHLVGSQQPLNQCRIKMKVKKD